MAQPPVEPGGTGPSATDPAAAARPATPPWVKVFAALAVAMVVAILLLLTGVIGKGHGPGRHVGGVAPGGRPAIVGVGGPADEAEAARTIRVTTSDQMTFQPAAVTVSAGEVVTFEVGNPGRSIHELTIGDAAMQQQRAQAMAHMQGMMPHGIPNSVTLQPGETKRLTWRFGGAASLEYACHIQGHYEAGMRGQITVI